MDARLVAGIVEEKFRFLIFARHGVIRTDRYGAERIAVRRDPKPQQQVVSRINNRND